MTEYKLVVDCSTGKQEYIALTPAEIADKDQLAAQFAEETALREAEETKKEALKLSAKTKLVNGEPLTDEEAAVIVI
jgi:hypothetical protein